LRDCGPGAAEKLLPISRAISDEAKTLEASGDQKRVVDGYVQYPEQLKELIEMEKAERSPKGRQP
jgi:hypothetical protein